MTTPTPSHARTLVGVALAAGKIAQAEAEDFVVLLTSPQTCDTALAELRERRADRPIVHVDQDPVMMTAPEPWGSRPGEGSGRIDLGADLDAPVADGWPVPFEGQARQGQRPIATASGIDPIALDRVHFLARQAIASEPDRAKAYEMLQRYSGRIGLAQVEFDSAEGGPLAEAHDAYRARLAEAQVAAMSDEQILEGFTSERSDIYERSVGHTPWTNRAVDERKPSADHLYGRRPGANES